MMKAKRVVLVTSTFYKSVDEVRFKLAHQTCLVARDEGYLIYVVDESPISTVKTMLQEAGAIVEPAETRGMDASRRQCFRLGFNSNADVIVWLEPEKYTFVPLIKDCLELLNDGCDIVLPSRRSRQSYPQYQELSEFRADWEIGIATGRPDIDWMFGPHILTPKGVGFFLSYPGNPTDTYEMLNVPVLMAIQRGMPVRTKVVDYVHPPEQTMAETGDSAMDQKRDRQREAMVTFMTKAAKSLGIKGLT